MGTRLERFEQLQRPTLYGPDGRENPVEIESVWEFRGHPVFKFRGVDSMTEAEKLQGYELRIPLEERAPAPEGEYFHSDLIDCEVVERTGEPVGVVTGWQDSGGTGLLVVKGEGEKEILVPFAKAVCVEIDVASKRIVVELPEGLKDL
jgi:16S rRNA processing protein RimM